LSIRVTAKSFQQVRFHRFYSEYRKNGDKNKTKYKN
jgi:hypothetical protein